MHGEIVFKKTNMSKRGLDAEKVALEGLPRTNQL